MYEHHNNANWLSAVYASSTDGGCIFVIEFAYWGQQGFTTLKTTCPVTGLHVYLPRLIQASILFRILSGV